MVEFGRGESCKNLKLNQIVTVFSLLKLCDFSANLPNNGRDDIFLFFMLQAHHSFEWIWMKKIDFIFRRWIKGVSFRKQG
ncbi:hypothetical protein EB118_11650 [bacterium]|nr:hypothetical protein [bacterium]